MGQLGHGFGNTISTYHSSKSEPTELLLIMGTSSGLASSVARMRPYVRVRLRLRQHVLKQQKARHSTMNNIPTPDVTAIIVISFTAIRKHIFIYKFVEFNGMFLLLIKCWQTLLLYIGIWYVNG